MIYVSLMIILYIIGKKGEINREIGDNTNINNNNITAKLCLHFPGAP